ncbi:tripartite tricarboxylate transporter permease [uncultured Methanobrevibacter sp.]|uniref:tripartite tricarboxylate transporter permease n=3 Tax=uncultured Methanobrevibacter sp. TaxID=253161 RepID=UPI0025E02D0E|nr:tripartite tricarboxylate transporter permease [uncultured Methanobrevibacter sp.]MCI6994727.1 tripartite tricarboxylate transporter permease [Methanobrevibacter sp.]
MIELVIACFIGILIGTTTGIIPGIHVNTAGAILFASSGALLTQVSPEFLCVLMVSMSIAHALIEFVPSMLLGVPQEGTATSILPGHRMVLEGRAKEVIRIVSVGGFGAIIVTIIMLPLFSIALPILHDTIKPYTWMILLVASVYLTYSLTANFRDFLWSMLLFILSGILGWILFQTPITSGVTLMCTFSGLFGISTILFSLNDSSTLPHQNPFYELNIDYNKFKSIFAGGITGAILGFLPGFGPAQGTVIAQAVSGTNDNNDDDTVNFLLATSGLNISDCLFSLMAIYIIGNPRSGIAVYMSYLISEMNMNHLIIFIFASLLAVSVSLAVSLKLGDSFSRLMGMVDYKKLSIGVILLQILILYIFIFYYKAPIAYMTIALITSTALGMLPHYIGVGKSHLMGVLIIPAIVIYMKMFI